MADVIQIGTTQNDLVGCFQHSLDRAIAGDVQVALVLSIDKDDGVSYSRAGKISSPGQILSMVGALEHHKAVLLDYLKTFDEDAQALAEAEENNESPDSS